MDKPSICQDRNFDSFKCLLLDMGRQRTVDGLLRLMTARLGGLADVALARVWLVDRGDVCEACHFRRECPDRSRCLHLVASAGKPRDAAADWGRTDGRFRRFPIGVRKVGHIAATGRPVEVTDVEAGSDWIADPGWAEREGVRGFVGQPLLYQDEILGVLGVFLRVPVVGEALIWLRMIADHAASTIVTARAFEEIGRLKAQLEMENEYLRGEVKEAHAFGEIIGGSPALAKVLRQVELVAPTDTGVLILGESGVGKELIARAIHDHSPRSGGPMIKVNCASVPRELFESEFFGHVRGSFTGAVRDRVGRFELAAGGTLFLDEVGEIPPEMQGKLLRVLQEGTYERIGEERTRAADVRVVAATNRDLQAEVAARRFRQDLYYRLSVFPIEVPPLRERREDIPPLAEHFLRQHARRVGVPVPRLKQRHTAELQGYGWPGNVRELQNVVERAVILSRQGPLRFDLPGDTPPSPPAASPAPPPGAGGGPDLLTYAELKALEVRNLRSVLERCGWKISGPGGAAEFLGVHPATLSSRLKALGVRRPR